VATNVLLRGTDTLDLDHVVQFDFAKSATDYLHRVGKVGRMGQEKGLVTNFIRKGDQDLYSKILDALLKEGGSLEKLIRGRRAMKREQDQSKK